MPEIHVCSLARVADTVAASGARHMVTLINRDTPVERPDAVPADNHLFLAFNDITEPMEGMVPPAEAHVRELLDFIAGWDRDAPIVVHCWAGISRSTAAAFITLCALNPDKPERDLALALRRASRSATPNARLVALADDILGRGGRMVAAVEAIGRGEMAFEGEPFVLPARHEDA